MMAAMDIKITETTSARGKRLSPFGHLLRQWRQIRGVSQLALAVQAQTSQRYISFLESGRARPSREMIIRLSDSLDIPLRERNQIFVAAGFAPYYSEGRLDGPELGEVRAGLELMLHHNEPHATIVVDRCWNLIMANRATTRLFSSFLDMEAFGEAVRCELAEKGVEDCHKNILRFLFHPKGLRAYMPNWEYVAYQTLVRARQEYYSRGEDPEAKAIFDEITSYEGFPKGWVKPDLDAAASPVAVMELEKDGLRLTFHSLITTFGTPRDVTLQELRVETFLPANKATADYMLDLAREDDQCCEDAAAVESFGYMATE